MTHPYLALDTFQPITDAATPPLLIDLQEEYELAQVPQVLAALEQELIGLLPVKTAVRELADLLLVERVRHKLGLVHSSEPPGLHMAFTGKPGTGKTTVALRMAEILKGLGYVKKGHLVMADRSELSGPRAKGVIERAKGGVLFIDEAYGLQEGNKEQMSETIEVLLTAMESCREDLVVIVAGYKDRMNRFFENNPGLASRIDHHISFPDFTDEELMLIAQRMLVQRGCHFTLAAEAAFVDYIVRCRRLPYFANGRSMRKAVNELCERQAHRLIHKTVQPIDPERLVAIDAQDVLESPVFKTFL